MTPLFPSDATLGSILQAFVYAGKFPHAFRYATSPTKGRVSGDFGEAAKLFSHQVLDGAVSPDELLQRHTMFPLMASLLSGDATSQWKAALIDGRRCPHRGVFPNFLSFNGARRSRCCPKCVEEDLDIYGMAHWRIPHQIPGLTHCIYHADMLCEFCKGHRCDAKFARQMHRFQLPSDPCWSCGAKEFKIPSISETFQRPIYQAYSNMVTRALQGQAWELRPETRALVRSFIRGISKTRTHDLISKWISSWGQHSWERLLTELQTSVPAGISATGSLTHRKVGPIVTIAIQSFAWKQFGPELSKLLPGPEPDTGGRGMSA